MQAPQLNSYFLHSEPQSGWSSCQNVGHDGFGNLHHHLCVVLLNMLMPATTLQTSHRIFTGSKQCRLSLHTKLMHCTALNSMFLVHKLLDQ